MFQIYSRHPNMIKVVVLLAVLLLETTLAKVDFPKTQGVKFGHPNKKDAERRGRILFGTGLALGFAKFNSPFHSYPFYGHAGLGAHGVGLGHGFLGPHLGGYLGGGGGFEINHFNHGYHHYNPYLSPFFRYYK